MNLFNLISAHQGLLVSSGNPPEGVVTFDNASGKGAYIDLGALEIGLTDSWTVDLFLDIEQYNSYAHIFSFGNRVHGAVQMFNNPTKLEFGYSGGTNDFGLERRKLTITSNGGSRSMYYNGVPHIVGYAPYGIGDDRRFVLGVYPVDSASDNEALLALIDNVAIYNYTKSATQIANEANQTPSLGDTGIIRYYTGYNDGVNLFEYVEGDHGVMNNFL